LSCFTAPSSQPLDLFIDDFGVIIVLPLDSLLLPLLETTDLNGNALEPIDLILDIPGHVIILILHSLLLLHLKVLDPGHGGLINIHTGLTA